jgi:hypothetical protein
MLRQFLQSDYPQTYNQRNRKLITPVEKPMINTIQENTPFQQLHAERKIIIPNPGEVKAYIDNHPNMSQVIHHVCHITHQAFKDTAQLSLEVDRDYGTGQQDLVLYVRQTSYQTDIMDKIESLWEQYENDRHDKTGWILIATDFQPPRP